MKLKTDPEEIEKKRKVIKQAILQRLKDNDIDLENGVKNEINIMAAVDKYLTETKQSRNRSKGEDDSIKSTSLSSNDENNEEEKVADKKIEKLLTQDGKLFEVDGKNIAGILYPKCLKEEIENHIESWIDSTITAFMMVMNIDYRIIIEDGYRKIVPIDYGNTGVTQNNMVWHNALHQVLQIINDVEVFPENLNTNFLYMITFFQKYNELYGLTGTIGSETNQKTLKQLYKVDLFFIPPNLKSQLKKRSEIVFTDEIQWERTIIDETKEIIDENRSVLLICRSIKEGEYFLKSMKRNDIQNIKVYFTEENKNIIEETLKPKQVIIATNLAGRGTDIKLTKELERSGGLHVIVSFLPLNQRVEEQNYGRAGRNGQKGSYSLIFTYLVDKNNPLLTVASIKKKREEDEKLKFEYFLKYEEQNMKNEEELFNSYNKFRKILDDNGNQFIKEDNEYYWGKLLLSNLTFEEKKIELEKLKKNEKNIISPLMKIKYFLDADNIEGFKKSDLTLFEKEPFYSWPLKMKYAGYLASKKELDLARKYYNEVIESLQDYQLDIQNQTVIHLFIFKALAKNDKFDLKKNKTKINLQNDRKKDFIQAIIDINRENLKVIDNYEELEDNEVAYIEEGEYKTVEDICKKINLDKDKNIGEIKDLKKFSLEFGIDKFEMLKIISKPNFWKNYLVVGIGVVEIAISGALFAASAFTGQMKLAEMGLFLIKQGFNDIVNSFKSAMDGKEIDLQKWGIKKLVDCTKAIIKIAIGTSKFGSIGEHFASAIKNEIIQVTKSYAIKKSFEFAYNKLLVDGRGKIHEYCNNFIGKPILNKVLTKASKKTNLIVMDLVNGDKLFQRYLVNEIQTMFENFRTYSGALKKIKKMFNKIANEKSNAWKIIQFIVDSAFIFKDLYPSLKELYKKKKCKSKTFFYESDGLTTRFDGTLKTLIKIKYQTYDENSRKKIYSICEQLIKYNVISKEGKFDREQLENEDLDQICFLTINEEFQAIIPSKKKFLESSEKILDFDNIKKSEYINYIKEKSVNFGKRNIECYKKEISEKLTSVVFANVRDIIEELMEILIAKFKQKICEFAENMRERKKRKEEEERKKKEEERQKIERERKKKEEERQKREKMERERQKRDQEKYLENKKKTEKKGEENKKVEPVKPYLPLYEPIYNKEIKINENNPNKDNSGKTQSDKTESVSQYANISTIKNEPTPIEVKKEEPKEEKKIENIESIIPITINTNNSYNNDNIDIIPELLDDESKEMWESIERVDQQINNNGCHEEKKDPNIKEENHQENDIKNTYSLCSENKKNDNNYSNDDDLKDIDYDELENISPSINYYPSSCFVPPVTYSYFPVSEPSYNISLINTNFDDDKNKEEPKKEEPKKEEPKDTSNKKPSETLVPSSKSGKKPSDNPPDNSNKPNKTNKPDKPKKGEVMPAKDKDKKKFNFKLNINKSKIKQGLWKLGKMTLENVDFCELIEYGGDKLLQYVFGKKKTDKKAELESLNEENINKVLNLMKLQKEKQKSNIEEENEKKEQQKKEGKKEWDAIKNKLIENEILEINYMYIIDESINEIYFNFKKSLEEKIEKIFENKTFPLIKEKHTFYFKSIKGEIPQIKTLNLIMAGFTGSGKTCLTNSLLKKEISKEGHGIKPEIKEFKQYSNPEDVPGLTIYDTIGVEISNPEHNIQQIQDMIKEKFDTNILNDKKSLHGIIYCIRNGIGDTRILKEEINYINQLNKLYGDSDILTVVFTQTLDKIKSEERKMQLSEQLDSENIEIIDILAKNKILSFNNIKLEFKAYGLDVLIDCLKKKCQKNLVKCNLKQIAKTKMKQKYFNDIKPIYKEIVRKIRTHNFEKNIFEECQFIIKSLIGNLNLDYQELEDVMNNYIDILVEKILEIIKNKNLDKVIEKINEEFIILNAKYNNLLETNLQLLEILKIKFNKFFIPKIKDQLKIILLEKTALIFLEKSRLIIGQKIGENIEDKEINELVNSNIECILQKIKN